MGWKACLIGASALLIATSAAAQQYRNPVLAGDWSDPDVVRVGQDFYLTASSFVNLPGLPILHSRDLIHWTIIGHALDRLEPDEHYRTPRKGGGVWAPAIRHHGGLFRIYYPDPDYGVFVVTAQNPAGPWSKPVLVDPAKGAIDPAPFWDKDGKGWLIHGWARSRAGIANQLILKRLNPAGTRTIDKGVTVIDGATMPAVRTSIGMTPWTTIEGPKLYARGGYYYIFAPAGGVKPGWQAVFRSRSITGPYEARNVLDAGSTQVNGPHQGAWVDTGTGEDWFLHFQDSDAYGRRVHLQPMAWRDGWPVIGADPDGDGRGEPVLCHAAPRTLARSTGEPQASDGFAGDKLSPAWQWNSNPGTDWANLTARPGWLRMAMRPTSANLYETGAILSQKLPGLAFTATVTLDFQPLRVGEAAGIGMFGDDYGWIGVERRGDGDYLVQSTRKNANNGGDADAARGPKLAGGRLYLRLAVEPSVVAGKRPADAAAWPSWERDLLAATRFSYSLDGHSYTPLGGRFLAKPGRWVGAQIGLFAVAQGGTPAFAATSNGHADFDDFTVAVTAPEQDHPALTPVARCP